MVMSGQDETRRSKTDWVGIALLLLAVTALVILNILKSGILDESQAFPLDFLVLYPLAYLFAALSLTAFAALLLLPCDRCAAFRMSAGVAALSALLSVAYAVGWWVAAPELMVWQDYAGIALQALACVLAAVVSGRSEGRSTPLLVLSAASVAVGTLIFLLPPLLEPAASVLTRALALASPMALLALGGLFTGENV